MKIPSTGESKKRVALFGGSFDPPHKAHQEIPLFLLDHNLVDEVWYIPVKLHPFGKNISADQDRLAMLQEVVDQQKRTYPHYQDKIKIDQWELQQEPESYTIRTLDNLAQKYPECKFSWVIGTDNLEKFHLWRDYQRILEEYGVFVYPRQGYLTKKLRGGMHYLGDGQFIKVSSTEIRQQLQQPDSSQQISADLILPTVTEYATKHDLYRSKEVV